MNDVLLIKKGDNLMNRLTSITGNVDVDSLTPSIWIAQITDIKRILTKPLYTKIVYDFENNSLTGDYLEIFDDYVSQMLVFYSTADFIQKNSIIIANGGNFKHSPDNSQIVDFKEVDRLVKHYKELGAHFEMEFYDWIKNKDIPEYDRNCGGDENVFKFNWQI